MPNVLITARYFAVDPEPLEVLRAHGCTLVHTDLDWTLGDGNVPAARTVELLRDVAGAIIASLPLTESVLAQAPALQVIAVWATTRSMSMRRQRVASRCSLPLGLRRV